MRRLFSLFSLMMLLAGMCYAAAPQPFQTTKPIKCKLVPRNRAPLNAPHIRLKEGTSTNWCGYSSVTNLLNPARFSVTSVSGSWIVPTITASRSTTYSSIWVGIDGYASNTVEQIGTEHDWHNGRQENYAWFEMYPQYAYELVGFPVNTGDSITAQVSYIGNSTFRLYLQNNTKGVHTIVPSSYTKSTTALRSSAEWIVEAPSSYNGVLPLADFSPVTLSNCSCVINNVTGAINNSHWRYDQLQMVTSTGTAKATASNLTNNGSSFMVTWKHQ